MSAERDELAEVVNGADWISRSQSIADAILAAGYRRPRQVTTVEELDALPAGTVIHDGDPLTCCKWGDGTWGTFAGDSYPTSRITLPATVLHRGAE